MDATQEEWRPVAGFEGFVEVSNLGRVRSLDRMTVIPACGRAEAYVRTLRGRILKQARHPAGYMYISFSGGRKQRKNAKVHHLVLEAFIGPRPEGTEGCHANDIPDDNRADNLRWDTPKANVRDKVRNGGGWKTHCKHGHELTPENSMPTTKGRRCRACARARYRPKRKMGGRPE